MTTKTVTGKEEIRFKSQRSADKEEINARHMEVATPAVTKLGPEAPEAPDPRRRPESCTS